MGLGLTIVYVTSLSGLQYWRNKPPGVGPQVKNQSMNPHPFHILIDSSAVRILNEGICLLRDNYVETVSGEPLGSRTVQGPLMKGFA